MENTGEEGAKVHEAHIPSSMVEDFKGIKDKLKAARTIQDPKQRQEAFTQLLQSEKVSSGTEEQGDKSLHDEVWEQLVRLTTEKPTDAEQTFAQESKYAASKVASNWQDLNTAGFEGLVVKTDPNGDVSDISIRKVLPEDNADRARKAFGLDDLPSGPVINTIRVRPETPPASNSGTPGIVVKKSA